MKRMPHVYLNINLWYLPIEILSSLDMFLEINVTIIVYALLLYSN